MKKLIYNSLRIGLVAVGVVLLGIVGLYATALWDFLDFKYLGILLIATLVFFAIGILYIFLIFNKSLFKNVEKKDMPIIYFSELIISYLFHAIASWYVQRTTPITDDFGAFVFEAGSAFPYLSIAAFTVFSFIRYRSIRRIPLLVVSVLIIYYLLNLISVFIRLVAGL